VETYTLAFYLGLALVVSALVWFMASNLTQSSILLGKPTYGETRPTTVVDSLQAPSRISFSKQEETPDSITPMELVETDDNTSLTPVLTTTGDLPEITTPLEEFSADDQTRYIVRDGDTFADIAGIFDVSVATIKNANSQASKTKLKAGTELIIPPIDGTPYTIRKGDTFSGIAKKFDVSADDIADFNYIFDRTTVVAGREIFIPNGAPLAEPTITVRTTAPSPSSASRSTTPSYAFSGSLVKPVYGPVTSPYGQRSMGMHRGIDFGAPVGTPIYAAGSGYVKKASTGFNGGFGTMAVIGHGDFDTLYAHMSRIATKTGAYVEQGQVIGYVGSTGRSTGPHLHFEVRVGGKPVNPSSYIR